MDSYGFETVFPWMVSTPCMECSHGVEAGAEQVCSGVWAGMRGMVEGLGVLRGFGVLFFRGGGGSGGGLVLAL